MTNNLKLKCKICGHESTQLHRHIVLSHKISIKQYKEKYNVEKVNIGWSKGLTKETDERVAKYGRAKAGRKITLEQKSKQSKSFKKYLKTHKHPSSGLQRTDLMKEKIRKKLLGGKQSKETSIKKSISMTKLFINKKIKPNTKFKHGHFFSKLNNKEFYYRSSYELEAYKLLDDDDAQSIIKSWDVECLKIVYVDENKQLRYTVPDIFVEYKSGKKQLIECKNSWRLKDRRTQLKIEATKKYCDENGIVFSIWTEKELGII
jgi:hypothetical protein